jgi:bifunctional DNA-binding transcriptional regulator/antitoxin component of YhaV-PrlF toxin-antitoxin module
MIITVADTANLVSSLPVSIRRRAGLKAGDHLEVKASPGVVTITTKGVEPAYRPTKTESAAIRKGRAAFKRGDYVTLSQLHNELDTARH